MTPVELGGAWSGGPQDFRRSGWLISVLLHGGALALALHGMGDLQQKRQPETFQWDVMLAPPPAPVPAPREQAQPAQSSQPVPQKQAAQPKSVSAHKAVERPVMERTAVVQTARVIQRETPVMRPIEREAAVQTAEAFRATPVETSQPIEQAAVQERPTAEPIEHVSVQTTREVMQVSQAVVHQEVQQVEPVEAQAKPEAVPVESVVVQKEALREILSRPSVQQVGVITQSVLETVEPPAGAVSVATVQHRRVESTAAAQADFGWLAESLWKRIEDLKRYPSIARSRRWEGKVIVEAVIRHDGEILDCQIAQSSGHGVLDQDALTVLRRASPLPLKHPLGREQVTILVPIAYRLAG